MPEKMLWITRDKGAHTHSYDLWKSPPKEVDGMFFRVSSDDWVCCMRFAELQALLAAIRPDLRLPEPSQVIEVSAADARDGLIGQLVGVLSRIGSMEWPGMPDEVLAVLDAARKLGYGEKTEGKESPCQPQ